MMFPGHIIDYLRADFEEQGRPFCFMVDGEYRLLQCWGDASPYGLSDLEDGADMLDHAPYLLGYLGEQREIIPFVSNQNGRPFKVHIIPHDHAFYIVLLDVGKEHDFLQDKQQLANELRLLHASQEKLINRQKELIGELVEAKAELDHRRKEAERSADSKGRFIAMMSHEFRTPLASVVNYSDLILDEELSQNDVRKSIEAITRSSRHLLSLVDTLLDEARLDAGKVQLSETTFSIEMLADDLAAIMAPLAAEKGLAFAVYLDPEVPRELRADDVCLRQILINLLGNAVKFTEQGGVRLDLAWESSRLCAAVTDTGPGISSDDQKRIFKAFERVGESRQKKQGAGLGLAITLGLAKLMGGEIALDSEPGKGCKITVAVPAEVVDSSKDEPLSGILPKTTAVHEASRPATILLCDDDEDMIELVEFYLQRAGYGLVLARDGEEAVEKALAYDPDLVLMDFNLPKLSGQEAARSLRASGFDSPIVALTATRLNDDLPDHFTASFRKPIPMPELLERIKEIIR